MENYNLNHELNYYDQIEGIEFDGLMPKFMEAIGVTTGNSEKHKKMFEFHPNGSDSLETVDIDAIMENDNDGGMKRGATEQQILDELSNSTGATVNITVPEGQQVRNLTIPPETQSSPTITGEFADGAIINNESSKDIKLVNTSESPTDITITSNGRTSLVGDYNNINLNSTGISSTPNIYGDINISYKNSPVSISAKFVGENQAITYDGKELTVSNSNAPDANLIINAPNASVTMSGKYNNVEVTCFEETLILRYGFHANSLKVNKGNVILYGTEIDDFTDNFIGDTEKISPMEYDSLKTTQGVSTLTADTVANNIAFPMTAAGKYEWNLNNFTYTNQRDYATGIVLLRGSAELTINGPGKMTTSSEKPYGLWTSGADNKLNIYGGDYEANTHCLYCELGEINVYGGTFKLLNAETADRDLNGNLKFLVNCKDENYKNNSAKINIYGGKFYEFDPSHSYGEPNGPVSFVADGYKVEETTENGIKVFEVVHE